MEDIKDIKKEFKDDYNSAIEAFKDKNYKTVLHNIRQLAEGLSTLLIFDFIGKENAVDVLSGNRGFVSKGENKFEISARQPNKYDSPKSSTLIRTIYKAYLCGHPNIGNSNNQEDHRQLNVLKSGIDQLCYYHSIESELGSHSGYKNTTMDNKTQAISCVAHFNSFIDWLKGNNIVSQSLKDFFNGLEKIPFEDGAVVREKEKEIVELRRRGVEMGSALEEKEVALKNAKTTSMSTLQENERLKKLHAEKDSALKESEKRYSAVTQENEKLKIKDAQKTAALKEKEAALKNEEKKTSKAIQETGEWKGKYNEQSIALENEKKKSSEEAQKNEELQKRYESLSLSMEKIKQEKEKEETEKKAHATKSEEEKQAYEKEIQQRDEKIDRLNRELEEIREQLNTIPEKQSVVYKKNDWDIGEGSLDEDQIDVINQTTDRSMLVTGCAGSGKSLIAAHKAELLKNQGENVILITLTTSLTDYMRSGNEDLPDNFFTHNRWKEKLGMPAADYIIVDEIQDFTEEEIKEFIAATNKHFFFFGDTAQSIYGQYKKTTTIDRISELTGLDVLYLYNNYRLPRPVAKITEDYVGVNVQPYREKNYKSEETELPHFIKYISYDEQLDKIAQLVKEYEGQSIGILLPNNKLVHQICEDLVKKHVLVEYKFDENDSSTQSKRKKTHYTLKYNTWSPKVMTYHSAKGVQFDVVVLPLYNGATDELSRKELYVAMTRTVHCLFVLYSSPTLLSPLDKVPSDLYLKE